ncbi:nose resistant to fluoxetine protein 6-like [Bacillus rossius redtenbacheri]|uniref:nose resistant to fluoxetine protein 6-like n=1 Tax=Bacillus rossius redtenbacheri TaxID=93214 RepID=UPI002FDE3A4E
MTPLLLLLLFAGTRGLLQRAVRASRELADPRCRADVLEYLAELQDFRLWAVRMFDSSAKFPDSITSGAIYHLGNFDACLDVDNGNGIRGRYCLARVQFQPKNPVVGAGSAWDKLKAPSSRLQVRRDVFRAAVCVPAACGAPGTASWLRALLAAAPELNRHVEVQVAVPEAACCSQEEVDTGVPAPAAAWIAVIVLLSIIALSTAYDNMSPKLDVHNGQGGRTGVGWRTSFSLTRHWGTLSEPPTRDAHLHLACLDGLRVAALLVVVVGHRGAETMTGPVLNGDAIEQHFENFGQALIMNGHLVVDTFFTISGYLLCWACLNAGRRDAGLLLACANRYVRLIPALMTVVAFEAFFLFNLYSGPLWKESIGSEVENCRSNWWTNALLVNNYVHQQSPCVDTAWYVACDFQLFIVSCALLKFVKRMKEYGFMLLLGAVVCSVAVTATLTYVRDLDPTMIPDQSILEHNYNDTYLTTYITAYCRSGPYFVGMLFAYWLFVMKTKKLEIHKVVVRLGWIICPLVAVLVIAAGILFYLPININKLLIATYAGLHRPLFGMCIAFIITACAMGNGGVVAKVLEWKAFRPFSRLTYCVYLVHYTVQMVRTASLRTPKFVSDFDVICDAIPDIVLSLCFALLLFLAAEQPAISLWNEIISAKTSDSEQSDESVHRSRKAKRENYFVIISEYFSAVLPGTSNYSEKEKLK